METYLLNSAACLAVLLLFYKLLLENESMHFFKRFYLLVSVFAAFIIPLITFTSYVEVLPNALSPVSEGTVFISEAVSSTTINGSLILWIVYGLGVLVFSIKFSKNLLSLILRIKQNPKLKNKGFINVLLKDNIAPHTFFSYLFFNSEKYLSKQIPQEVIIHEEAHAKQLHSLDILLIEFLQILFWFNPLIYLAKNAIKLNHEFLADQSVIKNGVDTSIYQKTLLAFSSNAQSSKLANAFNYSSIKKRFTVMKTQTSKPSFWVRSLLILPLMAFLIYGFSTKDIVERKSMDLKNHTFQVSSLENRGNSVQDSITFSEVISISILKDRSLIISNKPTSLKGLSSDLYNFTKLRFNESGKQVSKIYIETSTDTPMNIIEEVKEIIKKSGDFEIYLSVEGQNIYNKIGGKIAEQKSEAFSQDIATKKMVKEYNTLAKKYNSLPKNDRTISREELGRMVYIFDRMSREQRNNSERFPEIIVPKNAPPPPMPTMEDDLKDNLPPPPPPASEDYHNGVPHPVADVMAPPPPPPAPPVIWVYMKELSERGAVFYLEGKQITGKKAVELTKNNKNINIQVRDQDTKKPIVKLSKDPIQLD